MKKIGIAIAIAFILSGCDQAKIDTSNDENTEASIQKVRESLPEEKRAAYDEALKIVAAKHMNMADIVRAAADKDDSVISNIRNKVKSDLAGKTGEQVISFADKIKKEKAAKEKVQGLQEIGELEKKQKAAEVNLKHMEAFKVLSSRFYIQKDSVMNQPIIALSVENGTNKSISKAHFKGIIASPGREVPWYTDTFSTNIAGGLAPGEKADWSLKPNPFSGWGKVKAPADAVFTVTVTGLDDASGKPVFSDASFTGQDANRLAALKAKYPDSKK